jgi:hypothetical protein
LEFNLKPALNGGNHFQQDIIEVLESSSNEYWDLIILHPECTAMALCGNKHYGRKSQNHYLRTAALQWTEELYEKAKKKAKRVCLENPASVIFKHLGIKAQYIQPYQFGHLEQKKTGLALHNLPKLDPTEDVYEEMMRLPKHERERIFYMSPSVNRGENRSIFYTGIAEAMAEQWGSIDATSKTSTP